MNILMGIKLPSLTVSLLYLHNLNHSGLVLSKHGLYVGSLGSIPTAVTTRTAAGGNAEHVSLNH